MEVSVHVCKISGEQEQPGLQTWDVWFLNPSVDTNQLARRALNLMWSLAFLTYSMDLLNQSQENQL